MADTKITALTAISTVDPAVDVLPIVDVSDTTMAASGTTKKITSNQILGAGGTATLASATITGDLTVDTSTLKVDSANNRVGVNTASPAYALDVVGIMQLGGSANPVFRLATGTNTGFIDYDNTRLQIHAGSLPIYFVAGNTLKATLDSSGNLGLGVTPSALWTGAGALQQGYGAVYSNSSLGAYDVSYNSIRTASDSYVYAASSLPASRLQQRDGIFKFYNAPSSGVGGAGTVIAWTQAMTLNASGYLGVGTTNPVSAFVVSNAGAQGLEVNPTGVASSPVLLSYNRSGSAYTQLTASALNHVWQLSGTTSMTLDASGNLIWSPSATPPTLGTNGQLTVNATSNTNLRFSYRGSDGVTRVANLTLA